MAVPNRLSLLLAVINFCTVQVTWSKATIEIKFLSYSDRCTEDIVKSKCDPKFKFCLDRPRPRLSMTPCFYGYTSESGHYQDSNYVDFSNMANIKGIPNPWIITTNQLMDSSIFLVIQVRDDDFWGDDDHLQTWGTTMAETAHSSKDNAPWATKQTSSGAHKLVFKIRIYCEANYYNPYCTTFCLASDGPMGHYNCDPKTGTKICLPGWTGTDCAEDIDECSLNYCDRGICVNLQADYFCSCPSPYTGKNCTERGIPCDSSPCQNNAVCTNTEDFSYKCTCTGEWEGENCDIILNPCKSEPCQNGAKCKPSADHFQYFCSCVYPYTGVNCDAIRTDITTSAKAVSRVNSSVKAVSTVTSSVKAVSTVTSPTTAKSTVTSPTTLSTAPVREPTATVREPTAPVREPTANESTNLVSMTNKASEAAGRTDTREAIDSIEEAGIQNWHGALIAVAFIIFFIIAILCLLVHRRRRKQKLLAENTIAVYSDNNNLAFENNVYNDVGTCARTIKARQKQHTPLPDTPTEDDHFAPMKPVFTPGDNHSVQGAEGGTYTDVEIDMDTDGYMKAVDAEKYNMYTKMSEKPGQSEPAVTNLYSDFNGLKKSENLETEEVHYHDLDEIAIAVKEYSKVIKQRELKLNADCQFAVNKEVTSTGEPYSTPANKKQSYRADKKKNCTSANTSVETAYTDVPNNIPALFGHREDAHKTSFNADFPDDPFMSVSLTHDSFSTEDPYIEPGTPNDYAEPDAATSVFNRWAPADKKIDMPNLSNLSETSKEDGIITDQGLPQPLALSDGEYSVPRSSQPDHLPVEKPEFQYDTPPRSGSSSLLHTKKELPRLHNGLTSAPPVSAAPKPLIKCRGKKVYSEETNNLKAKTPDNNNGLFLPVLQESISDQPIDSNGWDVGDYPLPISIKEGYNNHKNGDGKESGKMKSQSITLEDSGFSQT